MVHKRKIIVYIAVSADGFIARSDGSVEWLDRLRPKGNYGMAIGLQRGYRLALFPIWFFAIAAIANGIAHPVLAVVADGYFPGLITSPVVGVVGVLLWVRLQMLTRSSA